MKNKEITFSMVEEFILNNRGLAKINAYLSKFNPIKIMGMEHMEIKHSKILGWLLDARDNHKFYFDPNCWIVAFVRDAPNLVDGLTGTAMKDDIKEESKLNPRNYLKVSKADSLLNQYECLRENHIKQFSELEDLQRELDNLAKGEIHDR